MLTETYITLVICSDSRELAETFIKKHIFRFPLANIPEPLEICVTVRGIESRVRIVCEGNKISPTDVPSDIVVKLVESPTEKYASNVAVGRQLLPRLIVGGASFTTPVDMPNTSWVAEVAEGWLESLVTQHQYIATERQVYSSQMEKFTKYIAEIEDFVAGREISRPVCPDHPMSLHYMRETINDGAFMNRDHPVFRKLFETKFGLGSPYQKKMGYTLSISKKFLTVYFVSQV